MAQRAGRGDDVPAEIVDAVLDASRALVALSARSIAAVPDITFPQFRMLVVLTDGSRGVRALADALDVAPSTALRMVDRLVDAGMVQREVRPDDRRTTWLSLTAAGRRTVAKVTRRRRRDLAAVLGHLSPARRVDVARAMSDLAVAAEAAWGERRAAGSP